MTSASVILAVPVTLGAAACYASSSAVQHRAARQGGGDEIQLGNLARLALNPLWLLGIVADIGGLLLQVLALSLGPVTLVQPLQVTGLLFALPIEAVLAKRRVLSGDLLSAALVAGGLGLFLGLAGVSSQEHVLTPREAGLLGVIGGGVIALLAVGSRRLDPTPRSAALGACAGIGFAGTAIYLESLSTSYAHGGLSALLTVRQTPSLVGLVLLGACGLVISQAAFSLAGLGAALPAVTVVDPVVAVVLAAGLLHERLRVDTVSVTGFVVAVVLVLIGSIRLAHTAGGIEAGEAIRAPEAAQPVRGAPASPASQPSLPARAGLGDWRLAGSTATIGALYGLALSIVPVAISVHVDADSDASERLLLIVATAGTGGILALARAGQRRARAERDAAGS